MPSTSITVRVPALTRVRAILVAVALTGLVAAFGVLTDPARAATPSFQVYYKANDRCFVWWWISPAHYTKVFNPSDPNEFWREHDCGAPTSVIAGADKGTPLNPAG